MAERTDQEWIRQLKQKDEACIADLWQMLFQFAWQAARKRNGSDDLAHEAAIAAYKRIRQRGVHQYQFACPFPGYCRVIVVRELLRLFKKQPPLTSELNEENEERIGKPDAAPTATEQQLQQRLQPCLERLTERLQLVIQLLYFRGLDPEHVGQQLSIQRNYVNQLAHRARKQLKRCMEAQGFNSAEDAMSL